MDYGSKRGDQDTAAVKFVGGRRCECLAGVRTSYGWGQLRGKRKSPYLQPSGVGERGITKPWRRWPAAAREFC